MDSSWFDLVRTVPDFPSPGIQFLDLAPLIASGTGLAQSVIALDNALGNLEFNRLAAVESRGFLFATPLAVRRNLGVTLLRKSGKLPGPVEQVSYDLEYGTASIEIQKDALAPGDRVVLLDDILATGGTLVATRQLVERFGATVVAALVLIEISPLGGRARLADMPLISLIRHPD